MKTRNYLNKTNHIQMDAVNGSKHNNNKQQGNKTSHNLLHRKKERKTKTNRNRNKRRNHKKQSAHIALNEKINRAKTFIKNISDVSLTNNEILVLSKNLKFVPTPRPPTTRDIIKDFDDLARRMRTRLWIYMKKAKRKLDPFLSKITKKVDIQSDNIALENYLTETKIELANLHNNNRYSKDKLLKIALHNIHTNKKFRKNTRNNFNQGLRAALKRLKSRKDIIIKKSDKGNCTVVINREQYVQEGMRQLNSCTHYTPVETDLTPEFTTRVHNTLQELLSEGEISKKYVEYLSPLGKANIRTAELYLLNKVHSNPPTKARPIISANGCPVERISEYVDFFLQPFVLEQHTFIKDTSDFIRKIELITVPDNALIITLDYESMYTNIIHEEAVSAVRNTLETTDRHNYIEGIRRPKVESFCKLVDLAVKCNNFRFNGKNFYQSMGVAMGHRASPAICDIVIYYLEKRILEQAGCNMFKWLRFRDDVFALYTGNETEARQFLDGANKMHPTLKFKYEISENTGTFLDTTVFKGRRFKSENKLDFKPYIKPSEKFQYIHRQSAHPKAVFKGLIKGELIRFVRTSTNNEDYLNRAAIFKEKLLVRGYSNHEFEHAFSQVDHGLRQTYLQEKTRLSIKDTPLVFTTTYNPHLRGYSTALTRSWRYIEENELLKKVFPRKPILAFRRNKNLQDTLVRARLPPREDDEYMYTSNMDDLDKLIALLEQDPDSGI